MELEATEFASGRLIGLSVAAAVLGVGLRKFRRRNFAHAGPDLNKTELAGIHHPVDSRTTDPGGLTNWQC